MVRDRALDFAACASAAVGGFLVRAGQAGGCADNGDLGRRQVCGNLTWGRQVIGARRHVAADPAAVAAPQRDSIPKTYPNGQVCRGPVPDSTDRNALLHRLARDDPATPKPLAA